MHHEDDEALPILMETAPLLIQLQGDPQEGWLNLISFPVGPEIDGDWEGSWRDVKLALEAHRDQGSALCLEHAGLCGLLRRQSVAHLLQESASGLGRCAAVVLDQRPALEVMSDGGSWDAQHLEDWAAWSSCLPEHCIPVVIIDASPLSPAAQLHLASADLPAGLVLAIQGWQGPESCEVPWLGVEQRTSRGVIAQLARPEQNADLMEPTHRVGVVVPPDRCRTEQDAQVLVDAIHQSAQRGWGTRLVREEEIHQTWHGLSALVVLGDRLTGQGRRQLAGFYAAGGLIFWLRSPTGMVDEQDFQTCHEFPILD
jgi:hypothetical protein